MLNDNTCSGTVHEFGPSFFLWYGPILARGSGRLLHQIHPHSLSTNHDGLYVLQRMQARGCAFRASYTCETAGRGDNAAFAGSGLLLLADSTFVLIVRMTWLQLILLGAVQGATEFLPVSSSGHLVIAAALFKLEPTDTPLVVILLHAATLLSIVFYFHKRIILLFTRDRKLLGPLFVWTLPAAVVGITIQKVFPNVLERPLQAGAMLLVTAAMLAVSKRIVPGETNCEDVSYRQAFLIGLAQAAAIAPGISRSGSTIVTGLWVGLRRVAAAEFSFLLALPVIGGAAFLELWDIVSEGGFATDADRWGPLLAAMASAFLVGLASLAWLVRWLQTFRLHYFAWWCGAVGIATIIFFGFVASS